MNKRLFLLLLLMGLLAACAPAEKDTAVGDPTTLTLMTYNSFAISEEVLAAFETAHNVTIELLPAGDAGALLNQAILTKDEPLADLLFGVDNSFMGRALAADLFVPYPSPGLADVPAALQLDSSNRLLPVSYGDVCLNYDKTWFAERALPVPETLADLTDPAYKGLLVAQNPATSSPGLAFLLATIAEFGTEGAYTYLDYWADLQANDLLVTNGWDDAYYGYFTATGGGERPLVVSYASSPPAEFIYADPPLTEAPTASIVGPGSCFRQVEFVGILKGTPNQALAEAFVDYMLSVPYQEDIPLNMFVFPANEKATLPEAFVQWAQLPQQPAMVDATAIDDNRDAWIQAWTEVVLR